MSEKNRRILRVERELREQVSAYLISHGVGSGFLSVTRVECSPDLRYARVFVSSFGEENTNLVKEVEPHLSQMQRQVAAHLQMKYTPKLTVYADTGYMKGLAVDATLRRLAEERT